MSAALRRYIANTTRRKALATSVRTSTRYLWQLATRWQNRRPSAEMAVKIESATAGKVPRSSLRPDLWPRATKPATKRSKDSRRAS